MTARLLTLALAAMLAVACGETSPVVEAADAPPAETPGVDARLHEGGWAELAAMIRAENAAGRPVVVNLFASWCEPCVEEAPVLRAAARSYSEVAFVGVAHRDLREPAERFLEDNPLGFPTLWDFEGDVAEAIQARGMPTTAFFDTTGELRRTHIGMVDEALLAEAIGEIVPEG